MPPSPGHGCARDIYAPWVCMPPPRPPRLCVHLRPSAGGVLGVHFFPPSLWVHVHEWEVCARCLGVQSSACARRGWGTCGTCLCRGGTARTSPHSILGCPAHSPRHFCPVAGTHWAQVSSQATQAARPRCWAGLEAARIQRRHQGVISDLPASPSPPWGWPRGRASGICFPIRVSLMFTVHAAAPQELRSAALPPIQKAE